MNTRTSNKSRSIPLTVSDRLASWLLPRHVRMYACRPVNKKHVPLLVPNIMTVAFPPIQRCTVSSPVSKPTSHSFHWVTALKSTVNPSYCQRTPHLVVSCTYPAPKTTCRRIRKKGYQLAGLSNTRSIRRWFYSSSGGGRDTLHACICTSTHGKNHPAGN